MKPYFKGLPYFKHLKIFKETCLVMLKTNKKQQQKDLVWFRKINLNYKPLNHWGMLTDMLEDIWDSDLI